MSQHTRQSDIHGYIQRLSAVQTAQLARISRLSSRNSLATRRANLLLSLFYNLSDGSLSKEEIAWKAELEQTRMQTSRWGQALEKCKDRLPDARASRAQQARQRGGVIVEGLTGIKDALKQEKDLILQVYKKYESLNDAVATLRIN